MFSMEERLLLEYFGSDPEKLLNARARLAAHEPLAYILGETVFFDETYKVTPAVLIPRPDTERVVEKVLAHLPAGGELLDLCTGSGCIAISSLCHSKNTRALLVDISENALEIAKENAQSNGVLKRCSFEQRDLMKGLPEGRFDVIVSNPPYVQSTVVDTLEKECSFEPRIAFDGGLDGGDFYRKILDEARAHLKEGGRIVFEIGYDQRSLMEELCGARGFGLEIYKDYGKNDRVAVITP
ncbi:MAG: peptide chain release factor N(5)-glutamine methyltransferase [Clostridia bacterium]|nr:peptide chain release factor N(5)-glutamine methyltransferase [Clostridia bacterium]